MPEFGESVKVNFSIALEDGTVLENTFKRNAPIEYKLGSGVMVPGFESSLSSLGIGERRSFNIPAVFAYGKYDDKLIEVVPVKGLDNADQLPVGQFIEIAVPTGNMRVKVLKIEDGQVYFDLNHELADRDLILDIELLGVVKEFDSNVAAELHPKDCACGCDKVKTALQ